MRTKIIGIFSILAMVSCGAIQNPEEINTNDETEKGQEQAAEVVTMPLVVPPSGAFELSETNLALVAKEQNLTFSLLSKVYEPGVSKVISPAGVQMALGMLFNGADGETAENVSTVAGFGNNTKDQLNDYFKSVMEGLTGNDEVTAKVANILVSNDSKVKVRESYSGLLSYYYYAPSVEMDFSKSASVVKDGIDGWVSKVTEGRIPTLLESVNEDDVFYLISATYVKGDWDAPFSPGEGIFVHGDNTSDRIPFIRTAETGMDGEMLPYYSVDGLQVVRKDLSLGSLGFYVILSDDNDQSGLLSSLADGGWNAIKRDMEDRLILMMMPVVNESTEIDYISVLGDLGEDYSGMFIYKPGATTSLGRVLQKNKMQVMATGIEGASAIVIEGVLNEPAEGSDAQMPIVFLANHPFIYLLEDRTSGLILYAGVFE